MRHLSPEIFKIFPMTNLIEILVKKNTHRNMWTNLVLPYKDIRYSSRSLSVYDSHNSNRCHIPVQSRLRNGCPSRTVEQGYPRSSMAQHTWCRQSWYWEVNITITLTWIKLIRSAQTCKYQNWIWSSAQPLPGTADSRSRPFRQFCCTSRTTRLIDWSTCLTCSSRSSTRSSASARAP